MAHEEQWAYCEKIKQIFPDSFKGKKVLDIGSFDVNGNEEFLFENCEFIGLDIGPGKGVDVICPAQDYNAQDESFDTIISCECWEHNPYYKESILNAIRMLKSDGLFIFTCATTGRPVHGTISQEKSCSEEFSNWKTMPNVSRKNWENDYYKNLTEKDILEIFDPSEVFRIFSFEVEPKHCDLYFWGKKR